VLLSDNISENVSDVFPGSVGMEVARMTDLFLTSVAKSFFEPAISCLEDIAYL